MEILFGTKFLSANLSSNNDLILGAILSNNSVSTTEKIFVSGIPLTLYLEQDGRYSLAVIIDQNTQASVAPVYLNGNPLAIKKQGYKSVLSVSLSTDELNIDDETIFSGIPLAVSRSCLVLHQVNLSSIDEESEIHIGGEPFIIRRSGNNWYLVISASITEDNDFEGLSLWLESDSITSAEGSTINVWTDLSGNGNSTTSNSGPTFRRGTTLNGLDSLYFDGSNDYLEITDKSSLDFTTSLVSFLVVKPVSIANSVLLHKWGTGGNSFSVEIFNQRASNPTNLSGGFVHPSATGIITANEWQIWTGRYSSSDSALQFYYNGILQQSALGTGAINVSTTNLRIGRRTDNGGGYFTGYIAAILLFRDDLDASRRKRIEKYLGVKYGIAI